MKRIRYTYTIQGRFYLYPDEKKEINDLARYLEYRVNKIVYPEDTYLKDSECIRVDVKNEGEVD